MTSLDREQMAVVGALSQALPTFRPAGGHEWRVLVESDGEMVAEIRQDMKGTRISFVGVQAGDSVGVVTEQT